MKNSIEIALNKVIATAALMGQLDANGLDINEQNAILRVEIGELFAAVGNVTPATLEALRMVIKVASDAGAVLNVEGREAEAKHSVEFGARMKKAFLEIAGA